MIVVTGGMDPSVGERLGALLAAEAAAGEAAGGAEVRVPPQPPLSGRSLVTAYTRVLVLFALNPRVWFTGVEVIAVTGLANPSVYPTLHHLAVHGYLECVAEPVPRATGASPVMRRRYRLTAAGAELVGVQLSEVRDYLGDALSALSAATDAGAGSG